MTFTIPKELEGDYSFAPGQYLTLRTTMDGEEVRRSYSICSGPDDGELRIAVKKVDGGAFSSWAADELKAGDSTVRIVGRAMPARSSANSIASAIMFMAGQPE